MARIAKINTPPTVPTITPILALLVSPLCSDAAVGRLDADVEVECEVVVAGLLVAVVCAVELFGLREEESVRIEVETV